MFGLFKKNKVDIPMFASELVTDLTKKYPVDFETDKRKKVSQKRLEKIIENSFSKAAAFKEENGLGVYGTAKLANCVKWELNELGYSEKFVDLASDGLAIHLAKSSATKKKN